MSTSDPDTPDINPMQAFKAVLVAGYLGQAQARHLAELKKGDVSDAEALHLTTETSKALLEAAPQIIDSAVGFAAALPNIISAANEILKTINAFTDSPMGRRLVNDEGRR